MTLSRVVLVVTGLAVACSDVGRDDQTDGGRDLLMFLPTCLRELTTGCAPDGMCGTDVLVSEMTTGECSSYTSRSTRVIEVRKPDGTLCYTRTEEMSGQQLCEAITVTWADPSGKVVATGDVGHLPIATCADTGETSGCGDDRGGEGCVIFFYPCQE
jgi:hypothetical protein